MFTETNSSGLSFNIFWPQITLASGLNFSGLNFSGLKYATLIFVLANQKGSFQERLYFVKIPQSNAGLVHRGNRSCISSNDSSYVTARLFDSSYFSGFLIWFSYSDIIIVNFCCYVHAFPILQLCLRRVQ